MKRESNNNGMPISIENVSFGYDDRLLYKSINMDVTSGFVSIIGPNGSGKSTFLKLITGMLKPTEGVVKLFGKDLHSYTANEKAKTFTAISQKQSFPFPFTCMELVSLGRYPYRRNLNALSSEDYDVIIDAMKATNVLHFKDKLITDISGGEQQRVILAAALAQQTKIIFLDEAFSALDISHKAHMVKLLREMVKEKGVIVVSIMHDLNIAYRYSDYVCLIEEGQIVSFDTPKVTMKQDVISRVFDVNVDLIEGKGFYINI